MKRIKKGKRQPYYCDVRGSWIIPLTQGRETLVDAEDVEFLKKFNWYWSACKTNTGYAVLKITNNLGMHRALTECPDGYMVDHINGNSLDNRKENLRIVTNRENMLNTSVHRSGRLFGAIFHKKANKWMSQIRVKGIKKHLGMFKTEHEAHQAYIKAYNELDEREKSAA